jgi:twitching motility two-component system response regulator PilG
MEYRMSGKKTFAVAMIGIPEPERHVLKNIFKLSLYRNRTYALASPDEPSEIMIVDADDPKAMAQWHGFRGDSATRPLFPDQGGIPSPIPTVMVTKEKLSDALPYYIRRPFVATRVLSVLDQVAIKELSVTQERMIGQEQPAPAPVQPPTPLSDPSVPTALVVDDSKPVRKQIELELKLFGIQVDAVESGEQAFEFLAQRNYDMIFLDVVLPGVDGYHICKTIKKDKAKKKTPVIMLTSKSSPFDRVRGALAGCDTYLTKPVKQASFQKVVQKYLKK